MDFLGNLVDFLITLAAAGLIVGVLYLGVEKLRSKGNDSNGGNSDGGGSQQK